VAIAIENLATVKSGMGLHIIQKDAWIPDRLAILMKGWTPKTRVGEIIYQSLRYLPPEMAAELVERARQAVVLESAFAMVVHRHPDSPYRHGGPLHEDRGIVSRNKVTTAGVAALCVAWGSAAFNAIYMALGTATTAEANTQTQLTTEIAASHYTGSVRPTCTHVESTNTVPIVGVHTQATAGDTIEEHGIFTSATQGAVTLWDRHLTGTTVLAVGDGITGTLTLTASAEA
jgi:hypothetical protein